VAVGVVTLGLPQGASPTVVAGDHTRSAELSLAAQGGPAQSGVEALESVEPLLLAFLSLGASETEAERAAAIQRILAASRPLAATTPATPASAQASTGRAQPVSNGASQPPCENLPNHQSFCVYSVQPGDTLSEIAGRFGLKSNDKVLAAEMLAHSNKPELIASDSIVPGQNLRIPKASGVVHNVLTSETLSEIAAAYGVPMSSLIKANRISDGSKLLIGQELLIPDPKDLPTGRPAVVPATPTPQVKQLSVKEEPTATPSPARTAESQPTQNPNQTLREAAEPTATRTPEPTATRTPEPTATRTPVATATRTPEATAAAEQTAEPTPRPRRTPAPTPTPEPEDEQEVLTVESTEPPEPELTPVPTPESRPAPVLVSQSRYIWPTQGPISSYFGPSHPLGIDIDLYANPNAPIVAARSGKVIFAGGNACCSYGLYVIVDHGDGVETLYAHFSRMVVSQGQTVNQGDLLGYGGRTGYATGEHLHFEIRVNGTPVNPLNYLP
jgi:murein DD-endopeptidase MepM/ murein hydrolase activator NlpD